MVKIVTVIGARPQFIKAAMVSKAIAEKNRACRSSKKRIKEILVHTGQHYDEKMSKVFFDELGIARPHFNLGVGSGPHGIQTARMLEGVESVLLNVRPDMVLLYGDTNSTIAGALAAAKLCIPVAHVEAGMRSFNNEMPEEINRIVTDRVSTLLFVPTETAKANLANEGYNPKGVHLVGDVMYDAALYFGKKAEKKYGSFLISQGIKDHNYLLATIHRPSNTDNPKRLRKIINGLKSISRELPVVLPMHPRTQKCLETVPRFKAQSPRLHIVDPVGYLQMMVLEKNARMIVTDSGGVQKEAYFHKAPCVTLRDETEWVELVEAGWNILSPPNSLEMSVKKMLRRKLSNWRGIYGNGKGAEKIVKIIEAELARMK